MKTALLPTDLSDAAGHALRYAIELLQKAKGVGRLLLLHTYVMPKAETDQVIKVYETAKMNSLDGLKKEREKALKLVTGNNVSIETLSQLGSLDNVITHVIRDQKIDFVVIGKRSETQTAAISRTLKRSNCPLFIAPD